MWDLQLTETESHICMEQLTGQWQVSHWGDSPEDEFADDSLESEGYELLSDEDLEEIIRKYVNQKYIGGYQKMKLDMRKKQEKKESIKVTKKLPMTAK